MLKGIQESLDTGKRKEEKNLSCKERKRKMQAKEVTYEEEWRYSEEKNLDVQGELCFVIHEHLSAGVSLLLCTALAPSIHIHCDPWHGRLGFEGDGLDPVLLVLPGKMQIQVGVEVPFKNTQLNTDC